MKRLFAALAALTVLCGSFAACSSSEAPSESAAPAESSAAPSEQVPASEAAPAASGEGEAVTLNMLSCTLIEKPDGDVEQEILDSYQAENPGITFEMVTCSSNDFMPKITAMVTAGDAPDLFTSFSQYIVALDEMGAIEPLDDLLGQAYADDVAEAVRGEVFYNGKLYIAPWGSIPTGIVYRADIFEEAGLEPPKTFDEVAEVFSQVTVDKDGDGKIDQYGLALIASNNASASGRFIPMLRNCGATELYTKDGVLTTEINSPGGIAILDYFYQWANVDKITPPGAGEIDHAAAINLLATEVAVATFSGPHTIGSVVAQNPALEGKFAGAPMPTLNAGDKSLATGNVNGVSISATSDKKEQAADYIKYLTSTESFIKYNAKTNRVPPLKSQAAEVVKANTTTAGFIDALNNAYVQELTPYNGEVQTVLAEALNAMASGAKTDAAEVAKNAEDKINLILSKAG